ncbi:serine/threonine protein kinase [Actinomadura hibisca]|uniref:serine/threonine protein kinase n=1 Tax=Actinomadura hibisca TaxID=68565 RepID=UPI0008317F1F|nr:serine/threonine-protein kinase [Actinomadura hibisca]
MEEGRLLGARYRLDSVVGQGGMGAVWHAHDLTLDREVAVKEVVLPPGLTESERNVLFERTFREARASARLNHPGVVTVHDVVEADGSPWIVMELVHARSLQELLDQGPLSHRRVAEIGLQMLGALRHAHEKGILHRDVKPSNVLITDTGRVVLTDFGIAQMEGDATLTQTGLVMGSPAYIPPERAAGERAVPASDLWSLGATLYAALEGHSPYERSDAMSSLQAALTEPVPPPRNAGPLGRVLDGLLAREPMHRMNAAQALPLLEQVARMPEPSTEPPTAIDATVLDEPPSRRGPGVASETVMDVAEFEAPTREDPASDRGPSSSSPHWPRQDERPGHRPQQAERPSHRPHHDERPSQRPPRDERSGQRPHQDERPSHQPHQAESPSHRPHQPERPSERRDPASGPAARQRPQVDPDAHTLLEETEWSAGPGPTPSTSQPWESNQQTHYPQWRQHAPAADRQRRTTVVIVTVAVLLVVVAVLAGAFLLRMNVTG